MEIIEAIKQLGFPTAVATWLMWFVSAYAGRIQRLIEWAIAAKHQIDNIEQNTTLILTILRTNKENPHADP